MNRLTKEAHALEDINGVRCAIVEKNVTPERVEFLKRILEYNRYTVMVAPSPPPKVVVKPAPPNADGTPAPPPPPAPPSPETFTIGVTDFLFHVMLAIYERALKTPEGNLVTIDYWNQQTEKEGDYYWKRGFFTNSL
ncbi:MAG: hypothetical protein NTV09_02440 [Bacteroidetes bacterium]|nr:hypothetical protein [Bacteroidota bacterium]